MPTVSVFPFWKTNPYLNLLFLEARANGWKIRGGNKAEEFFRDVPKLEAGDVLHIQWTSPFAAGITSETEYRDRISQIVQTIQQVKDRSVKVLWTVHNLVAHDADFLDCEVELAAQLAALADKIIILNRNTCELAKQYYDLPAEKIVHIPHPSYLGVYSGPIPQEKAQQFCELPIAKKTVGFVGAIRPYKGVDDFLAAAQLLAGTDPEIAFVLSGATAEQMLPEIERLARQLPTLHRHHALLSDEEMPYWVAACSVMVLPFKNILNSGSMLLAASYGVPVVIPDYWHLVEEYGDQQWVHFFPAQLEGQERAAAIASSVSEALATLEQGRESAIQFSRVHLPFEMAIRYQRLLEALAG